MPGPAWFKISETQELASCSDADLARNSVPRLPTEQIEIDRSVEVTPQIAVRVKRPVRAGSGTAVVESKMPVKLVLALGAIAASVASVVALLA